MNNNPGIPLNYVLTNPLDHYYWNRLFNPGYANYARYENWEVRFRPASPRLYRSLAPLVYVAGMIGYAVEAPLRVLYLASAIVRLVCCDGRSLFDRFAQIVQAVAGIFASVIGVACPLAGYEMDRWIYPNGIDPVADHIRNRQAAEMLADQNARGNQATVDAPQEARRRFEAMVAEEINRIDGLERELERMRRAAGDLLQMPEEVRIAEMERDQAADQQIAIAQRDANERVARLERELQHRLTAAQKIADDRMERLRGDYEARFTAFKSDILARLSQFAQEELRKERAAPGSSQFLTANAPQPAANVDYEQLAALYASALDLLRGALGENAQVVQKALAGTNRQAILVAWFLSSMERFGSQLPSPLEDLLSEALLGIGDGLGLIYRDYCSVLDTLNLLAGEENRVERLLRVALGQEGPDSERFPELRFQLGRIVVQLSICGRLLSILRRRG